MAQAPPRSSGSRSRHAAMLATKVAGWASAVLSRGAGERVLAEQLAGVVGELGPAARAASPASGVRLP